ncbi:MAG: HsdM family class I SAM-dependent methyltransferase [Nanoarchaeota archaeon]
MREFIVDMVNPKLGEIVLDPACGTGGFLTCTLENLRKEIDNVDELQKLGKNIRGIEKKPMPHLLCMTNLMLHDIEEPSIKHDNSLSRPIRELSSKDMVDVVVTNPPFGGAEEEGIENNFPSEFKTRETADLFLVMIMKLLREEGRCGIVLPDGFLFGEGVKTRIKEKLLTEFNLHTIVRLPNGVFNPYTSIRTNLLFFEKGKPTKEIWYFEHPLPEGYKTYNKSKPIQIKEFDLEKEWWNDRDNKKFKKHCWKVSKEEIEKRKFNLDINNPNGKEEVENLSSKEILEKLEKSFEKSRELIDKIKREV